MTFYEVTNLSQMSEKIDTILARRILEDKYIEDHRSPKTCIDYKDNQEHDWFSYIYQRMSGATISRDDKITLITNKSNTVIGGWNHIKNTGFINEYRNLTDTGKRIAD